ncbi:hypothetical protein GA0074692_6413 [Micromonospora pallida]|uniref:Polyketide cyclase / dehydrase and lipid transport n=1 Tax=Micromonospora pallida TaxID=145854 RepID=A0A1C6TIR5_9ACTN|nr:hypothetical protein [Micromonospora pallida]SCL41624.1 hypothetical protein GA0074692_6413 [Micromonospora pallida]
MAAHVERGMSAEPEVVFNTATDPDRASAWLPEPLLTDGAERPEVVPDELRARWGGGSEPGWSAEIRVESEDAGGARVRLELTGGADHQATDALAGEVLDNLAREVDENLAAG